MSTDYERDTERIERGQQARNVSPECWRNEHELCECNALICRCECHRVELEQLKAKLPGAGDTRMRVELTYFKPGSGKYYTNAVYDSVFDKPREIFDEVKSMREDKQLPGLVEGAFDFDILVNIPDLYPALLKIVSDPDARIRELESERREYQTLIRMCLQQFEFQYGKRKRGWDAKFLMDRCEALLGVPAQDMAIDSASAFADYLPLSPVRIAPGEYAIKDRSGRTLWTMNGAALADWVCQSVNGYDGAVAAMTDADPDPDFNVGAYIDQD